MRFDNTMPIYLQVIQEIKKEMIQGKLPLGAKMPSARELGIQYQINPNTASRIYRELELEKLCFTRRGVGTFVTEEQSILPKIRSEMAKKTLEEFVAHMKALGFSRDELVESVRQKYEETGK